MDFSSYSVACASRDEFMKLFDMPDIKDGFKGTVRTQIIRLQYVMHITVIKHSAIIITKYT